MSNTLQNCPQFDIIHYVVPGTEMCPGHGIQQCAYVVVKNTPFEITLRLPSPFTQNGNPVLRLDGVLLYDNAQQKEVGAATSSPFTFVSIVKNPLIPSEVTVEGKIKVRSFSRG